MHEIAPFVYKFSGGGGGGGMPPDPPRMASRLRRSHSCLRPSISAAPTKIDGYVSGYQEGRLYQTYSLPSNVVEAKTVNSLEIMEGSTSIL